MKILELQVNTTQKTEMIDITSQLNLLLKEHKVLTGTCYIYCPHTTAGITINENADPTVVKDMLFTLNKLIPKDDRYLHSEGNSDAHIKASLIGSSQMVLIDHGKLMLGTWQGVYFCEFDGPRTRRLWIKIRED